MDRKEIINFLDSPETYNKVLSIISSKCQENDTCLDAYPQSYYLAGGSVANTIHYLLRGSVSGEPVINDIDLFFFNHQRDHSWGYNTNVDLFVQETINQTMNLDGYGRVWLGSQGEEIRMVNSERFGVVNKVTIDVHLLQKEFKETDYYQQLLNNFDLNCTTAGLDRINGKIIYNEKFVDFLENNKIEVVGVHHPLQTAIRFYKKTKELNTDSSNLETEMSLLQHSFLITNTKSIGPEWISKSADYDDFLMKYFVKDVDISNTNQQILYYSSKDFIIKPYFNQFNFRNTKSLIVFWDFFVRLKSIDKLNKLITFYKSKGLVIDEKPRTWSRSTISIRNNFINNAYYDLTDCLSIAPNYLDCDFELSELLQVDNFFKTNSAIDTSAFVVKNIKEQIKFIEFFNKNFIDKEGSVKNQLLYKIISHSNQNIKDRMGVSSLDFEEKSFFFSKNLNNLWIKSKNSNRYKHYINKKIIMNHINFSW
jgi:hypothetical protein